MERRNFSGRLPSKMEGTSKFKNEKMKKFFCETSFEAPRGFLRDFLQNGISEAQKRSFSARRPPNGTSKLEKEPFLQGFCQKKTFKAQKLFCEASFKNDMSTTHLTSEFQYVSPGRKKPRHTKS